VHIGRQTGWNWKVSANHIQRRKLHIKIPHLMWLCWLQYRVQRWSGHSLYPQHHKCYESKTGSQDAYNQPSPTHDIPNFSTQQACLNVHDNVWFMPAIIILTQIEDENLFLIHQLKNGGGCSFIIYKVKHVLSVYVFSYNIKKYEWKLPYMRYTASSFNGVYLIYKHCYHIF
jgi:hypothetical protein